MTKLTTAEREIDSHGASTLVNTLMNEDGLIHHAISYWQRSVNGQMEYMTSEEKIGAKNIQSWYDFESKGRSYKAPNWKVPPERTALFAEFRNDPNYVIKNIVELVTRSLIFEMLKADGITAKVMITTDSDDVFSATDAIAAVQTPHGEEYVGFDIAVSENPEYIAQKEQRTRTICREFNMAKNLNPDQSIPRMVFAIPPRVMAEFISTYMKRIATSGSISRDDILPLFQKASLGTAEGLSTTIHNRFNTLIH